MDESTFVKWNTCVLHALQRYWMKISMLKWTTIRPNNWFVTKTDSLLFLFRFDNNQQQQHKAFQRKKERKVKKITAKMSLQQYIIASNLVKILLITCVILLRLSGCTSKPSMNIYSDNVVSRHFSLTFSLCLFFRRIFCSFKKKIKEFRIRLRTEKKRKTATTNQNQSFRVNNARALEHLPECEYEAHLLNPQLKHMHYWRTVWVLRLLCIANTIVYYLIQR